MNRLINRPPRNKTGRRWQATACVTVFIGMVALQGSAWAKRRPGAPPPAPVATPNQHQSMSAEVRLLEIYRLIGAGQVKHALDNAHSLVQDVPNFQLAQLVYGDLLLSQAAPLKVMGSAPTNLANLAPQRLDQLRMEAERRLHALRAPPPENTIPTQFIELPPTTKNAIAVDASRSRLYLFENGPAGLHMVASHYVSIGRLGAEKTVQGDQRTPLGVYYITSRLGAKQLTNFYGSGALPLNYPNEYDRRLGRTGSGIWLHGVPSDSYARSPNSTDGCVVLANPELESILEQVQPRSTPVVIAKALEWVPTKSVESSRHNMRNLIEGWRVARASGDLSRLMSFYSPQFANGDRNINQWRELLEREVKTQRGRSLQLKDMAILGWRDKGDVLVVTFGEVSDGQRTGAVKRQYWGKENGLWKIFFEGVIG
ncbi:MAG: L,D-transpeptidase family protein [Burkholderiales bacterium]|nr:L,D-transpeptidase family protein [Burkholderiales bacterium]